MLGHSAIGHDGQSLETGNHRDAGEVRRATELQKRVASADGTVLGALRPPYHAKDGMLRRYALLRTEGFCSIQPKLSRVLSIDKF